MFLPLWAVGQTPYAVDTSFYTYRSILNNSFYPDDFVVQADGKLVVVGSANWTLDGKSSKGAVRLFPNGTVDTSFRTNLNNDINRKIFQLPNNEFLFSRIEFGSGANTTRYGLSAISSNGTLINRYQVSYRTFPYPIEKVALQNDGKLIIVNSTPTFEIGYGNNIIRINPDGQRDSTFQVNLPDSTTIYIYALELLENGKILLGGSFRRMNGANCNGFVRLNSNGSTDTSFRPQVSFVSSIQKIGENQFVTVARNTAGNSPTIKFINSDGEITDTTFRMQTFGINFTHLNSVQKLFNGKYLVKGTVSPMDQTGINNIAFLDQNGVLDTSYTHQIVPPVRGRFRLDKIIATENATYINGDEYGWYENTTIYNNLFKINGFRCGQEQAGNISISDTSRTCLGTTTTLTAPPAANYLWSNGETTQSIDAFLPGNYTVRLATPSGCLGLASAPVSVNRTNSFCNLSIARRADTLTASLAAERYRWFRNQQLLSGIEYEGRSIVVNEEGIYSVQASIGTFSDTAQLVINSTSKSISAKEVKLYPNPSSGRVNIQSAVPILTYSVIDNSGRVILRESRNTSQVDLTALQQGVYQIHLISERGLVIKSVIKK